VLYLETLIELEQLSVLAAIFRKELSSWKGHVGWVMSVGFGWVSLGLSRVFGFSGFRVHRRVLFSNRTISTPLGFIRNELVDEKSTN